MACGAVRGCRIPVAPYVEMRVAAGGVDAVPVSNGTLDNCLFSIMIPQKLNYTCSKLEFFRSDKVLRENKRNFEHLHNMLIVRRLI